MGILATLDKTIDVAEITSPKGASTMGADEAKGTVRDLVEAFSEHIKEKHDWAIYGVDSETVDELRAMEGGEEVLGHMAERRERDRDESSSKDKREAVDGPMLNSPTKVELDQRRADAQSRFKYGVDADIADMIRELDGGDELLGRMAERKDAAREAAADKSHDGKISMIGYVSGEAAKPMLTASAGGASAAIGDALDAAQSGVSNMLDAATDFASERTAMAKDMLAGVKDVVAETGDKAADAGVEL